MDYPKKILIVDDNQTNLTLLTMMLNRSEYDTLTANSGIEAIQMYKDNNLDIILMDYRMPIMNGAEATKQIRDIENQDSSGTRTPIIIVSGSLTDETRESLLNIGVDDFIDKPIIRDTVVSVIQNHLERL